MAATKAKFSFDDISKSDETASSTMVIGKKQVLENLNLSELIECVEEVDPETHRTMLDKCKEGSSISSFVKNHMITLGTLPEKVTRNNHPWSVHTITDLINKSINGSGNSARLIFAGNDVESSMGALASATAKAFPMYSQKTGSNNNKDSSTTTTTIHVSFVDETGTPVHMSEERKRACSAVCDGVQLAARLVDMTPAELTTTTYSEECRQVAEKLDGVTMTEIVGSQLDEMGYGGIYGVGKAATEPPRLVILEYEPPSYTENVALCGKGIIYDTGGLSLKPKTGMCGMKHDMGGSAAMLGAFYSAVQLQTTKKITLLLCLAENAIGPTAFRNDDILTLYSGKTVEINNCDAEGRLVLGDGVAHATKNIDKLDLVIDMATLTGAQLVCTGKKHGGILANTFELEQRAVQAGLHSGDLVFPMLYAPELLMKEFDSKVADMKNSVKDRNNGQSSCAGHFIESHLDENYKGGWLHCDMAGPGTKDERGTGYGVGLILSLLEAPGF